MAEWRVTEWWAAEWGVGEWWGGEWCVMTWTLVYRTGRRIGL